jgi:hypothetical protein
MRLSDACFVPIIDSLLGLPKTRPRDRSNRLLDDAAHRIGVSRPAKF